MTELINFYDELGFDRSDNVAEIQEGLKRLRLQLSAKVGRPSTQQEEWKKQLERVTDAVEVFKDEDSKEAYDIQLSRVGKSPNKEEDEIDWVSRAWNYFIIGDNGAAFVASRKAKEQKPDSPQPYVVAAWVQLADHEYKQAKHEADEAFVLDELTEDSVDVQKVRGNAFYFLDDYDRALMCFDRALAKAAEGEKPELYWYKAKTYAALENWQTSYDNAILGLSVNVEILDSLGEELETAVAHAYNQMDNASIHNEPEAAAGAYSGRCNQLSSAQIGVASKHRLTQNATQNIERCTRYGQLKSEQQRLQRFSSPSGGRPLIPIRSIGAAVLFFFFMIGGFQASAGFGFVLLLIDIALFGFVYVQLNNRKTYDNAVSEYEKAQGRLQSVNQQLNARPSLTAAIVLS